MKLNFRRSESLIEPALLDLDSSPTTVYIRKNVRQTQNAEGLTVFQYEEAALPLSQYEEYKEEEAAAESLLMQKIAQNFEELNLSSIETAISAQEEREALGQQITNVELLLLESGNA